MNLNKVQLIGRVTKDPEMKALPSGIKVTALGMATNKTYKDKDGAKKETTEFHNVVAFGKQAETIAQYVKRGQLIYAEGRIQTRSWDDKATGKKVYRTEIVMENFQFGPKPGTSTGTYKTHEEQTADQEFNNMGTSQPSDMKPDGAENIDPDDIPF